MPGIISENLTSVLPEIEAQARRTYPGMAHFAGSGPFGKTCRECSFWEKEGNYKGGLIKPGRCRRYRQLTQQNGPKVPESAAACRHFDAHANPPERFARKSEVA